MEETLEDAKAYPKANSLNRYLAKFIDLLITVGLSKLLPPVGFFAGLLYIIIADGLFEGQSIGKKLIGLRAIALPEGKKAGFREAIIRNIPFAIAYTLFLVPYIGWLLAIIIIGLEGVLVIGNELGLRIGDEIAKTQVIDYNKE